MGAIRDWFFGPSETREDPPQVDPIVIPSRNDSFSSVSSTEAVHLGGVFRAVNIMTTAVTQLSIDAFRSDELLNPAPGFIRNPDVNSTLEAFLENTVTSLALQGNAYWRINRDAQGRVQNLEVLNPLDTLPQVSPSGRVVGYRYARQEKLLPPSEVQHLQYLRIPGSPTGLGPIQAAQAELRGHIDLRDYAGNWFERSGIPSGVLSSDQVLNAEDAQEAKTAWNASQSGGVRVLGSGLNYKTIYLSPRDSQFLENRAFNTLEIARIFGIPAGMLLSNVGGSTQTYSNISQQWLEFVKFSLSNYTREIEAAFSDLLPRGTVARFNYEAFLRPDVSTRYQMHQLALTSGWMTPNEVRRIEGYPPIKGGDELKSSTPAVAPPQEVKPNA